MAIKTRQSMSADYQKSMKKLKKAIGVIGSFLLVAAAIVTLLHWINNLGSAVANRREVAEVERSVQAEQRQQVVAAARAQTVAAQQSIEGIWSVVDGADTPVYIGDYTIDRNGNLTKFQFEFSFTGNNGNAYSNTWSCSLVAQSTDRYDCSYTQRWDGGSIREPASLTRVSSTAFSGRYMYRNLWREITFQKQG